MPYSKFRPELMGAATLEAPARIEAGSMQELVLTYTCGAFGIDDTGSIKIGFRFATDMGELQFSDPKAPGYTTAEASNDAPLTLKWEFKRNIRPWSRSLYIGVSGDYLSPGDRIVIRFGDKRRGSPGVRMQTYCESAFEFRVFVDAIATYDYVALPESPKISLLPGPPRHWQAVVPTLVRVGEPFTLRLKAEDRWRNPSDQVDTRLIVLSATNVRGLPDTLDFRPGHRALTVDGLIFDRPTETVLEFEDEETGMRFLSNPIRAVETNTPLFVWADTHGQSNETLGTNSIEEYFDFGRDLAFLDVIGHQGNDFQITDAFWAQLNHTTARFDQAGRFVCFPGYEWSANTAVGGDRNAHFLAEGERIHRSSHAQIDDLATEADDCWTADDLFARLDPDKCVVAAHVGGRYADIVASHNPALETAVEVHSSWGTFEWLLEDAFSSNYRVGVVANSDGHKGRPGACYPGASFFGSMGGLTCYLVPELSRKAVFEAMRTRRHYGTTGVRISIDVKAEFPSPVAIFSGDPAGGSKPTGQSSEVGMGAIVASSAGEVRFLADIRGTAPIERIDLFDGLDCLETLRPWKLDGPSRRFRLVYEGAAARGRSRTVLWDGRVEVQGNRIEWATILNNWNLDRGIRSLTESSLEWSAVTTGNFGAIDLWLERPGAGVVSIETPFGNVEVDLAGFDGCEKPVDMGGLGRGLRYLSLPETMVETAVTVDRRYETTGDQERRLYLRVQQEDGHRAWTSPIYIICED